MGRLRRSDRSTRDDGVTGRRDDGVTGRISRIRSHPVTSSPRHPVSTVAGLVPFTFGVLVLAGCSGLNQTLGIDPLLGGPPLRPATTAGAIPSAPGPLPVLPLPATNSTLSTAALAAGANVLVIGTGIFRYPEGPAAAVMKLRSLVGQVSS